MLDYKILAIINSKIDYMRHFLVIILTVSPLLFTAYSQCSNCTMNISGQTPLNINVYPGNVLCIASDGDILGDVINYGGIICNLGNISGDYIQLDGTLNNYGSLSNTDCILWEGLVNNFGTITSVNFIGRSSPLHVNNEGTITCNDLAFAGDSIQSVATLDNHGTISTNMFESDTSFIQNYGTFHAYQNFHINEESNLISYGILEVDGHYFNNGYSQIYCMAQVGMDLYNNGESAGPPYGCGGYSVLGSAYNNGDFGTDGEDIDLCKVLGPPGFDGSLGTIGPNVTYCSCNETCEVQFADIKEQHLDLEIYPNPSIDFVHFSSNIPIESIFCIDNAGRKIHCQINLIDQTINLNSLKPGTYHLLFVTESGSSKKMIVKD